MFKLTSTKLLQQIEDAITRTQGRRAGALLRASTNLDWVVFHEFGTATHFSTTESEGIDPGIEVHIPPESISPQGFYPTPGARLPVTEEFDLPIIVPTNPPAGKYLNKGVTPKGMIQTSLPETISPIAKLIAETLISSNLDIDSVQTAMIEKAGPMVAEAVAERIGESLSNTDRDTPGRLHGESPSDAFLSGIEIEPLK